MKTYHEHSIIINIMYKINDLLNKNFKGKFKVHKQKQLQSPDYIVEMNDNFGFRYLFEFDFFIGELNIKLNSKEEKYKDVLEFVYETLNDNLYGVEYKENTVTFDLYDNLGDPIKKIKRIEFSDEKFQYYIDKNKFGL